MVEARPAKLWLLALALAGPPCLAHAAPASQASADNQPERVIPPGREDAARELLGPVFDKTPDSLGWLGPQIEVDRIKWWLMRGEQARVILVLAPRELAVADEPLSHSFAIQVAWAPASDPPTEVERELVNAAVASVQARDTGQFYLVLLDVFSADGSQDPLPYLAKPAGDPAVVHRKWALKLCGVGLLGLFALGVTLRGRGRA
ncbi:hypothetical protein DB30_03933 [Enhygromyxa salina]|uniref:TPM domain-containing protein n=1 Tax=Enhygromyxa salina TaxID=215803 RepID=A0A0C1ZH42_9BACT|nr:hypothetical protein [Enhygromyxa salina]KIG16949.1 hypothetical protein DB30_03933 [Enhygromyxa salina]